MKLPYLFALFLLLALRAAPAACAPGNTEELLREFEETRVRLKVPAAAIVIVDHERVLGESVSGIADLESGRPADGETVFRIGSVTKMFTALAVLLASAEGKLQLDAPANFIVPQFPVENSWQNDHPLLVAHLLEHTAGLPDLSKEEFDVERPLPLPEALAWKAATRRCLWPPGMHHSYSNAGAGLASLLLEAATGVTYEDYVRQRIFEPLGMPSAGFYPDPRTLASLARGYDADGRTVIPYWHMLYRGFGAINVKPAEMAPFVQLLLNRGSHAGKRLVSEESILRMERPATTLAARAGLEYGYGLGNYTWLRKGVLFHGHGGDADGYLSRLGYSTEKGLGYFMVINVFRGEDLATLRRLVENWIAGDTPPAAPPLHALSSVALRSYTGEYEEVTRRFPDAPVKHATISADDGGGLSIERGGRQRRLFPVSEALFRYEKETVATSAFSSDGGRLYFQDDGGSWVKLPEASTTAQPQ